ncbi:MAG: septum formation initiator family protein, partial [Clostridia bacterium]|nr:septum formation initiator family protein [Clostridia bacterium]
AVVAVVAVYFIYVLIWQQITISGKNEEIDNLKQQVSSASEESERLKQEVENLNDPEYLERVARERLGLVRPNERVFVDSNKSEDNEDR